MKASSGLFAVLLILWSGASVYWYVCKIKKDCDKQTTEVVSDQNNKNENFKIKDTVSVINNLSEKLSNCSAAGISS